MSHATIGNIKHVVRHLKENDNYSPRVVRKALAVINEYDIDVRTISCDGDDCETVIRAAERGNPGSVITLEYRANSRVAYVLAGLGGCY